MSEDWDFYLLSVDDKPASIFVDLGIAKEAPLRSLPFMAYLRVYMKAPRPDGLSSREEFDTLKAIEDSFGEGLTNDGRTIYVGRNTSDGCRDIYFYTAQPDGWSDRVTRLMQLFVGYEFDCGHRDDPEWKTYFEFLYPSGGDRQRIENRRVCDALEQHGDLLTQKREIDHWAYFPNASARASFVERALRLGFRLRSMSEPAKAGDQYGVRLYRIDVPARESIDDVTISLFQLAAEHGGEYDGWETQVIT
jgi:Family of unknown function (DUF695)/Regulator of ribonuclease activity B